MKRMLLIGLVMASISISSIHAVGPCELYDHHVTYRGFSEKYRQIAIQESYSFCVESEAFSREMSKAGLSSDQALAFQFVTMYQTDGSVVRRYLVQGDARILSILNDTARQEVDFLNAYIDGGLISPQSIENVLTEGGFIAGAASLVSPSGKLKIQLVAPLVGEAAVPYRSIIFRMLVDQFRPARWRCQPDTCSAHGPERRLGAGDGLYKRYAGAVHSEYYKPQRIQHG